MSELYTDVEAPLFTLYSCATAVRALHDIKNAIAEIIILICSFIGDPFGIFNKNF